MDKSPPLPSLVRLSLQSAEDDDDRGYGEHPPIMGRLPPDLLDKILKVISDPDVDCTKIGNMCATQPAFNKLCQNNDAFWRWVCKSYGWDRPDRWWTVWTWDASAQQWSTEYENPWQIQYREWCGRRLDNKTIRRAVNYYTNSNIHDFDAFDGKHPYYGHVGCWDTSQVTDMSHLFEGSAISYQDLSLWTFQQVTTMSSMFKGARSFQGRGKLSKWTFPKVTDMSSMFEYAIFFNADVSNWKFPEVLKMTSMFKRAWIFKGDGGLSRWTFPKVTDMSSMFQKAYNFDADVSTWTFPKVTNMNDMFANARKFKSRFSDEAIVELRSRGVEIPSFTRSQ
jgi:hypothetical protein